MLNQVMRFFSLSFLLILLTPGFTYFTLAQTSVPTSAPTPVFTPPPFPKMWIESENGISYLYRTPPIPTPIPHAAPAPLPPQPVTVPTPVPTPFRMELVTLNADQVYFHWAAAQTATRWEAGNGAGLTPEEFNTLRKNGNGEAEGGGFYISEDFMNSDNFGTNSITVKLNQKVTVALGNPIPFFSDVQIEGNFNFMQWISEALQNAGLDGIAYQNLKQNHFWWINLYKREDIVSLTPSTIDDFLSVADSSYNSILPWLQLSRKPGISPEIDPKKNAAKIGQKFPAFQRFLDQNFNDDDLATLLNSILHLNGIYSYHQYFYPFIDPSTFSSSTEFFKAYLLAYSNQDDLTVPMQYLKNQISLILQKNINDPSLHAIIFSSAYNYFFYKLYIPESVLGPFPGSLMTKNFGGLLYQALQQKYPPLSTFNNDFLTHYYRSFAFIGLADRLEAQAQGKSDPWTLFDEPGVSLYDNWVNFRMEIAQNDADLRNASMNQPATGITPGGIAPVGTLPHFTANDFYFQASYQNYQKFIASLDALKVIPDRLSGHKITEIRGEPVIGGGDYVVDGIHYYRITQAELAILQANPYLTVESRGDPNSPNDPTWVLARHEYPSARTYTKFKNKLSASLLASLQAAETSGILKNTTSPEFHDLTRKVLNELWATLPRNSTPAVLYQAAMSLHPFADENGRTLRFLYSVGTGRPLILRNWDWDLFLSVNDFYEEINQGDQFFLMLSQELLQLEKMAPEFPKAYDAKSPYAFFFDNGNLEHIADENYLTQAKTFFLDPTTQQRVRQKLILESGNLESGPCSLALGRDLKD